jgi:hypothetical protein
MWLEADAPEVEPPPRRRFDLRRFDPRRFSARRLRESVAPTFEPVRGGRVTPLAVLAAAVAVAATAAYSLLRVGGAGAFNSIWAEDGANFLSDAYILPLRQTIFKPLNGYFVVLPRLIAEVAANVPAAWGPAVLSTMAAVFSAAMAVMVYVASGNVLTRPFPRWVAAFWTVAAPLAESTLTFGPNMVAPLQFVELYGLFWAFVWTPVRRSARVVQVTFIVACCLSTFLAVLFLPLALVRLWATRTRWSMFLLGILVAGGGFQAGGIVFGLTSRAGISHPRLDPLWALTSWAGWALPLGLVGEKTMSDAGFAQPGVYSGDGGFWYSSGVVATWLVVVTVILVAVWRKTRPLWFLAGMAALESVLLLCGQVIVQGRLEPRYAYTPSLLAVAALLALVRPVPVSRHSPRSAWLGAWFPAVALVFLLALSAGVNYRISTIRTMAVPWSVQVEQSTRRCRADLTAPFVLTYSVPGWFVVVPCDRVR